MITRLIIILTFIFSLTACDSSYEMMDEEIKDIKKVTAPFPSTVTGEVTFTWHIATDPSFETLFIKEYGEMEFIMTSTLYETIGVNEGSSYQLMVEPMKTFEFGNKKESYRIISGNKL